MWVCVCVYIHTHTHIYIYKFQCPHITLCILEHNNDSRKAQTPVVSWKNNTVKNNAFNFKNQNTLKLFVNTQESILTYSMEQSHS